MKDKPIGFIGAGNMATSMIAGLCTQGLPASKLWAADPNPHQLKILADKFGLHTTTDNNQLAKQCATLVIAVKPHHCRAVIEPLQTTLLPEQLLISIAAGITTDQFCNWLGHPQAVVRCMPNTPALVGQSASCAFANASVSRAQTTLADKLLRSIGLCEWITEEDLIDVATAISGSGPAYFFLLMEMLQNNAVELGLPEDIATRLVRQTAQGAASMVQNDDFVTPRVRVTSPGGTTACMIDHLEHGNIRQLFKEGLAATVARAQALAKETT